MTWINRWPDDRRKGPRRYEEAAVHVTAEAVLICARGWVHADPGVDSLDAMDRLRMAVEAFEASLRLAELARKTQQEALEPVTVSLGGVTPDERQNLRCSAFGDVPDGGTCHQPVTTKMHVDGAVWSGWASCDLRDHQIDVHARALAEARRRQQETAP